MTSLHTADWSRNYVGYLVSNDLSDHRILEPVGWSTEVNLTVVTILLGAVNKHNQKGKT